MNNKRACFETFRSQCKLFLLVFTNGFLRGDDDILNDLLFGYVTVCQEVCYIFVQIGLTDRQAVGKQVIYPNV